MVLDYEKPFYNTRTEEEKSQESSKVFTIRLNREEIQEMEDAAKILRQEKFGSTAKQLIQLGISVLHDPKIVAYLEVVFNNERRNQRLGINKVRPKF